MHILPTFLAALDGTPDMPQTWVMLDDRKRGLPPATLRGTWAQVAPRVISLQMQGFGVYHVAQGMTDTHRKERKSYDRARALFVDLDDRESVRCHLPPSAIVRTSQGKAHYYWFLKPGESIDAIEPALRELVRSYGSDPACVDLARVLRTPGTVHVKGDPHPVTCVELHDDRRYTIKEVVDGLRQPQAQHLRAFAAYECERLCRQIQFAERGERNKTVHKVAWQIAKWTKAGHLDNAEASAMMCAAAAHIIDESFPADEFVRTIQSAASSEVVSDVVAAQTAVTQPTTIQSAKPMDIARVMLRAYGAADGHALSDDEHLHRYDAKRATWSIVRKRELQAWLQDRHGCSTLTDGKMGTLNMTVALRNQAVELAIADSMVMTQPGELDGGPRGGCVIGGRWVSYEANT